MINFDDYEDDEGWIYLPWEELREIQHKKNEVMRQMLDNVALASGPLKEWKRPI